MKRGDLVWYYPKHIAFDGEEVTRFVVRVAKENHNGNVIICSSEAPWDKQETIGVTHANPSQVKEMTDSERMLYKLETA